VEEVLTSHAFSELDINRLVLAVDEVCANLIIHSHHCNPEESIELFIDVGSEGGVTFSIVDQGTSFDICSYQEPSLSDVVNQKKKGGVGLMLVKRIMDRIDFKCETGKNICTLYKKMDHLS